MKKSLSKTIILKVETLVFGKDVLLKMLAILSIANNKNNSPSLTMNLMVNIFENFIKEQKNCEQN